MLLLDVGNTRLKWGTLREGAFSERGALLHRDRPARQWTAELPRGAGRPERILVANVAGPVVAHEIGEWALATCGLRPVFLLATRTAGGVTNAYRQPESLGVDRWLAMIGARRRAPGAFVCIAAGTAMTVDAVDATGRHLGGWILPGARLMIEALRRGTADIARAEALAPPATAGGFGINTAGAVEEGSWQALVGAAERAVRLADGRDGPPRIYLSGGDSARLGALAVLPAQAELAVDLVLEGLAVLAQAG